MIEELVYKIVSNKIKEMEKYNYDNDTVQITMQSNIRKYLEQYKVSNSKDMNLINPNEQDIIMYLVYLLYAQKKNDLEALDTIQKLIDVKIDTHRDSITTDEIDSLINLFKTQIKLK